MKLVIFGHSVSSAWGNDHAALWRGILRALARERHSVLFFERDTPLHAAHRDLATGDGYEIVVYPTWETIARRAEREMSDADVGMVTSFCADARPASDVVLGSVAERVFYDLDSPLTLAALGRGEDVPYLPAAGLGAFDLVLSYAGGATLDALERRLGARRTAPLYGSVDLEVHRRGERQPELTSELSYLADHAADLQPDVERLFLAAAQAAPHRRFLLGGARYPASMARPWNVTWLPDVRPAQHAALRGSSRLTLSITGRAMAAAGYCPSGRLFEAAACGAPIITDAWRGLEAFFEPGREILVAHETADVLAALSRSDHELSVLARRARDRIVAEHTSERRARDLVELLTSNLGPSARRTLQTLQAPAVAVTQA